jgi:hypothetical protein
MITTLKKKKKKKLDLGLLHNMKVKTMEKKGGMPSPLKTSMSTAHGKISWKNQGK